MKHLLDYTRDQCGGTAVIAAITAIPLAMAVAGAIDMVRANRVQTVLQAAADSAAIAGATSRITTKQSYNKIVKDYLVANGGVGALNAITKIDSMRDTTNNQFTVWIEGKMDTGMLAMVGLSKFDIAAKSVVNLGSQAFEVALVLDNTASMSGTRISDLKDAAHQLVDDLMVNPNGNSDVKVGVVPFANYVNVGIPARTKAWMSVPAESSTSTPYCGPTYPNATSSNCRNVTVNGNNDGVPYTYTAQQCDWNYGAPVEVCGTYIETKVWYGCVGSRNSPLDESIGSLGTPYPGILNASCPAEVVPLTNSVPTVRTAIDGMIATGNTYIPSGLVWGWNMLEPDEPLKGAYTKAKMKSMQGTKAMVLMTDGTNTLSATYPTHDGSDSVMANKVTASLCENIKADGIQIYTIAFEVTDPTTKALLDNCATSAGDAFVADDKAALMTAFKSIAEGLHEIRLVQ